MRFFVRECPDGESRVQVALDSGFMCYLTLAALEKKGLAVQAVCGEPVSAILP